MGSFGGLLMRLKGDVLMYVTKPKEPNILSFTHNILTLFLIKSRYNINFFIFFILYCFIKILKYKNMQNLILFLRRCYLWLAIQKTLSLEIFLPV